MINNPHGLLSTLDPTFRAISQQKIVYALRQQVARQRGPLSERVRITVPPHSRLDKQVSFRPDFGPIKSPSGARSALQVLSP
jgi:hypothetical protein